MGSGNSYKIKKGKSGGFSLFSLLENGLRFDRFFREGLPARYLPHIASGEITATIALSEPDAESDIDRITTVAEKRGEQYVIYGKKSFVDFESEPTMNFGWFDQNTSEGEFRRVILYEFGHVSLSDLSADLYLCECPPSGCRYPWSLRPGRS